MSRLHYCISIIAFFLLFLYGLQTVAQESSRLVRFATVIDNDTVPLYKLKEVTIISSRDLLTAEEIRKNKKLIRNAKIVLPYAKMANAKLMELNNRMEKLSGKDRKKFIKQAEKEIEVQYGKELEKMTFSQGKLLIKLIDRETGNSSYILVQELRGSFRAFFYQAFAKIFGYDLKSKYDPYNNKNDELIERIVRSIELNKI